MQAGRRVEFLDGFRGVAALQVVALHYVTAFLPAIGMMRPDLMRHAWEKPFINSPAFVAIDGSASVFVFFLISGAALTYSFQARPFALGSGVLRRFVRLGVPMAASVLFAAALLAIFSSDNVAAGQLCGSCEWLGSLGPTKVTLWSVVQEIAFSGMLAGHAGPFDTIFPAAVVNTLHLPDTGHALNPPLWTLHFELYGSLLVLGLVALRASVSRTWHRLCCLALLSVLALHPLGLFVIGHLLAPVLAHHRWRRICRSPWIRLLGVLAILPAMAASMHKAPAWLTGPFVHYADAIGLPGRLDEFHLESAVEALLLFAAVMMLPPLQNLLSSRACRWLGKISFGLYLTHLPLLLTVASLAFVLLNGAPGASLLASVIGVGLSFWVASVFEKIVDQPAIRWSRAIGRPAPPARHKGLAIAGNR